jgi:hypothetical protein
MILDFKLKQLILVLAVVALAGCGGGSSPPSDSDQDGVVDSLDAFPNDGTESADSDSDGTGDNADAFPNDASETADSDGDGTGNNADAFPDDASEVADTDGDLVGDNGDNCPADSNAEQVDTDGDESGDVCDADQDGDSVANDADNCPLSANLDQADADVNGQGDACDAMPMTYAFTNSYFTPEASNSVSYTGQTARQILIADMAYYMSNVLTDKATNTVSSVTADLEFFIKGTDANVTDTLVGTWIKNAANVTLKDAKTYGDISTGKNLDGKIAGGNGRGGGETSKLIGSEFFGWSEGSPALPIDVVNIWIAKQAELASDGVAVQVTDATGAISSANVNTDAHGRNYRQLMQKFLMGAVNFSQATNDYFKTDFASKLTTDDGGASPKNYSQGEHKFDEGFGYYGAARDNLHYTDLEVRAKSGRDAWKSGHHDTNGDGMIDVRSEYNMAHSQNCAKRDAGSAGGPNPTDFSTEVMTSIIAARQIISNASNKLAPELTSTEDLKLQEHIKNASVAWEKCIAATAVHYVNDLIADMSEYKEGKPGSLSNFETVAKHWSELKGFVMSLQFSPASPFRDATVLTSTLDDLKKINALLGDAPVLADGSQMGIAPSGSAADAVYAYRGKLTEIRATLQDAYGFSDANTLSW